MTDDAHARANSEQLRLLREALAGTDAADRPGKPPAPEVAHSVPFSRPHRGSRKALRSP